MAAQPTKTPASHAKVKKPGQAFPRAATVPQNRQPEHGRHLHAQAGPVVSPRQLSTPRPPPPPHTGTTPIKQGSFLLPRGSTPCLPKPLSEDNILGLRKWPLNQFSHDIILPGCETVRLGGSGFKPRGCSQMSCFQTGPAPKGRRGQACRRGSPG